jgi:hypothetical protein
MASAGIYGQVNISVLLNGLGSLTSRMCAAQILSARIAGRSSSRDWLSPGDTRPTFAVQRYRHAAPIPTDR